MNYQEGLKALDRALNDAYWEAEKTLESLSYSDLMAIVETIKEGHVNRQLILWIREKAEENKTAEDEQDELDMRLEDTWRRDE